MHEAIRSKEELWLEVPPFSGKPISRADLQTRSKGLNRVIVVIDDDPTGIQTVHGINVYMHWNQELLREAFATENVFYIQTNSRAMSPEEAKSVNREIMENIIMVSTLTEKDFSIISRSDSTLRGHYPLETRVLRQVIEEKTDKRIDGEILIPFFLEGGRFTVNDIHYVQEGDRLVPAAQTEFAGDRVFGFASSDLKEYVEEKTAGEYSRDQVVAIPLEMIRQGDAKEICERLEAVHDFGKVVVNALSYEDLEVFCQALLMAEEKGKRFLFRTAASFVRVYGLITPKGLLQEEDFRRFRASGGKGTLVAVGSHVQKTTEQLKALLQSPGIRAIELDVEAVLAGEESRQALIHKATADIEESLQKGWNPVLFTSRKLITREGKNLSISQLVSATLVQIIEGLKVRPACMIAKGGITSSDLAVKALKVVKAEVLGQVLPGIPVIQAGPESKWPGMAYIIFPGNVGDEKALQRAYEISRGL
jgi:uncharacterized protein YgbK (DUF1537 family)